MKDTYALLRDPILEASAKKIFGDILEKAFVTTNAFKHDSKADTLKSLELQLSDQEVGTFVDVSGVDIVLVFSNGRMVMLTNSEWGTIKKVSKKNCVDYTSQVGVANAE